MVGTLERHTRVKVRIGQCRNVMPLVSSVVTRMHNLTWSEALSHLLRAPKCLSQNYL